MLCLPHGPASTCHGLTSLSAHSLPVFCNTNFLCTKSSAPSLRKCIEHPNGRGNRFLLRGYRSISFNEEERELIDGSSSDRLSRFDEAVKLFNKREYYACHDLLESLWYESNDPLRTLLHAILQCAVAFHHLFCQNHKGAMMEMGEGICKLRKLNFEEGPFHKFEQEISAVLNFIYQTQLELAACNEDFCVAMEQTERSYQLLEGYGAGQHLYFLEGSNDSNSDDIMYIVFDPQASYGATGLPPTRVKLPTLQATGDHLIAYQNY